MEGKGGWEGREWKGGNSDHPTVIAIIVLPLSRSSYRYRDHHPTAIAIIVPPEFASKPMDRKLSSVYPACFLF
jgi:hypothetical protein